MRAAGLSSLARAFQKALLPALCVACDGVLDGDDRGLCGTCCSRLVPMSGPCCPRCGSASDNASEPCLACAAAPPPQTGTVLWGAHDGILRRAILALKHGGHDELARPLGRRLAARIALEPWYDEITVVVPVPSHRLRLLRRGASAAGLLAAEVAADLDLPRIQGLRRHGLGRQAGRTRAQRKTLGRGCFSARGRFERTTVLLVDDVSTTGTTQRRAAETLVAAGAEAVYCAAMAQTPDPRRM